MPDFSNVRRATEVRSERSVVFKLYAVSKDRPIELDLRPATEANASYLNARLKAEAADQAYRAAQRGAVSADILQASRRIDIGLFADHVVTGWRNVCDATGAEVGFSAEAARELFAALETSFDDVRDFAKDKRNFTQEAIDAQALAKN